MTVTEQSGPATDAMADRPHIQRSKDHGLPQTSNDGAIPQWQPNQLAQEPALAVPSSAAPHQGGWSPNAACTIPLVPSREEQTPWNELPKVTDPHDLYLPDELVKPEPDGQEQPHKLDDLDFPLGTVAPGQLPQFGLPGLLFGADFQWDFNPTSTDAANIWSQMPAQSWLDTSEGWNVMLRPESPNPTEGDLSVDPHAVHYITKTASIVSNNLNEYVEDEGRKYHRFHQGKYLLPNDEREQDRLDLQHAAYTMLFHGQLSLAPFEEPKRVLDIATGTGIWAIEFAEKWPSATVIGTDLSPIQPDSKPANCRFWVEDAEDPWHFEVPFDYIHARLVCSCFDNPRAVIQQAYDNLKPGGWLEFQDGDCWLHCDDGTTAGTAIDRLFTLFNQGAIQLGRDCKVSQYYRQWFIDAGFEDVVERKFKLPGNTWPKDPYAKQIGLYEGTNIRDACDALSKVALKRGLGMTEEERRELAEQAKFDAMNPDIHWYVKVYAVYGRKPVNPFDIPDRADVPEIPTSLAGIGTSFC